MYKLNTDKKYTVILSAYMPAFNTPLQDLINTELMKVYIEHDIHAHAIRGIGYYGGGVEQCFIVHTNSTNVVNHLKRYALDVHRQECILISNNRTHKIHLCDNQGDNTYIGTKFIHSNTAPKGAHNYTVLNGTDFYIVE